jgi:hypothetical protein
MKRLPKIVTWLEAHKPSIGFYIGRNPWDSSEKDAEIKRLNVLLLEKDNMRREERAATERIILSLSMQKEALQRERQANNNRIVDLEILLGKQEERKEEQRLKHLSDEMVMIEAGEALEARVRELEAQLCRETCAKVKALEVQLKEVIISDNRKADWINSIHIRERTARLRVQVLESFVKEVRDNYDCDQDAHKYQDGRGCRCCEATALLPKEES